MMVQVQKWWWSLGLMLVVAVLAVAFLSRGSKHRSLESAGLEGDSDIALPQPQREGDISVEEALQRRRSVRDHAEGPLSLEEVGQLLWAAQGISDERGYRTAPSAGALYPLELYVVVGEVETLAPGIYHYDPQTHALQLVAEGERREALAAKALGQTCVRHGTIDIVFTAIYERVMGKYGERGRRYVHMEAGHAAQNVYLQCASLELGAVVVGAFEDKGVQDVLELPEERVPLYIMPVGRLP
ncbi:MAG: SagB/ThcOx family dehydrogenase [Anaerolineales bacterium]